MAVYAYCILDNNVSYTTFTNLTFSIDGSLVGSFSHTPDGSGTFLYNQTVYANDSVPNGDHTFIIHSPRGMNASLVLFDYVEYMYDDISA
ncbi:hypothetical protein PILCRDRAFT_829994 [Piloderma croceum F 1598]|uniref:Uncharacterized protein n=1 Tax=Piloderma croceum (strain F 1598) TaxID=765440 RepID=A0A0C3AEB3_PILCF|nr:hypothetical protein PILCRDRAFT_829994 [Piloderma croceum F 1598]